MIGGNVKEIVGKIRRNKYGRLMHRFEKATCSIKGCGSKRGILRSTFSNAFLCGLHREIELRPYEEKRYQAFIYRMHKGKEIKAQVGPALAPTQAMLAADLTSYAKRVKITYWRRDEGYLCGGYYTNYDDSVQIYLKGK